jgi:hypothetical protein
MERATLAVVQRGGSVRRRPLRRYRELVCLAAAVGLWLLAWAIGHGAFTGAPGRRTLVVLAVLESIWLAGLFGLEWRSPRRRPAMPWITMAWLSLPLWVLVELLAAMTLKALT